MDRLQPQALGPLRERDPPPRGWGLRGELFPPAGARREVTASFWGWMRNWNLTDARRGRANPEHHETPVRLLPWRMQPRHLGHSKNSASGGTGCWPGGLGGQAAQLHARCGVGQAGDPRPIPWSIPSLDLSFPICSWGAGAFLSGGTRTQRSNTRTLEPESRVLILAVRPWADGLASLGRGVPIRGRALVDRAGSFNGFPQMLLAPQHTKGFLLGTDAGPTLLPQKDQPPPGKNNFWIQFLFSRGESGVEAALRAGGLGEAVKTTVHGAVHGAGQCLGPWTNPPTTAGEGGSRWGPGRGAGDRVGGPGDAERLQGRAPPKQDAHPLPCWCISLLWASALCHAPALPGRCSGPSNQGERHGPHLCAVCCAAGDTENEEQINKSERVSVSECTEERSRASSGGTRTGCPRSQRGREDSSEGATHEPMVSRGTLTAPSRRTASAKALRFGHMYLRCAREDRQH